MANKISIRFFNDCQVRAVWKEDESQWLFSIVDIIGAIRNEPIHSKRRNYWKYLKAKLKASNSQLVSETIQLKLLANDGKYYLTDLTNSKGIITLVSSFPNNTATPFLDWFLYNDNTIDGKSKKKAYDLFESGLLNTLEPGSIKCLQQIHSYIFGGLYSFAGQIRSANISKDGFIFAPYQHFHTTLPTIENMPEQTFDQIVDKYVEMNIAHPFMEGNGRTTRIWLDLIFKRSLKLCIDWSKIEKHEYLNAMRNSHSTSKQIKTLLKNALTDKIDDRETFMKGIDYSYYYEES